MINHPLPISLRTSGTIVLGQHTIPLASVRFTAYSDAEHTADTFGGKALIEVDGRPQFAEVAILRLFEADGWQGRWVETYGKPAMRPGLWREWHPDGSAAQVHVPIEEAWVNERLHAIAAANGNTYSGCWDVVVWKGDRLVFAESKRKGKDRMRDTQLRWMKAAMRCGCPVEDFVVVEWGLG